MLLVSWLELEAKSWTVIIPADFVREERVLELRYLYCGLVVSLLLNAIYGYYFICLSL